MPVRPPAHFVGREAELAVLQDATAQLLAGIGGVFLVEGEPGIGKSSLIAAAAAAGEESGCAVLRGTADQVRTRCRCGCCSAPWRRSPRPTPAETACADPPNRRGVLRRDLGPGMAERDDVDLAGYLGVAAAKHSALTAAACELGALAAGASRNQADHLRRFGDDIGLARKHVDDVPALHDDLVDGCRGLRLVAAAAGAGDGRTWCEQQAELLLARGLSHLRQAGLVEADELAGFARTVTRCRRASPAGRELSYGRRTSFPAA